MSCDYRHCPPRLPILPSSPARRSRAYPLASVALPLKVHEHRTRSSTNTVRHVQVMASSIFVISWKCFVLGKPRARMPNACLDSWKCRSKFLLLHTQINRLITQIPNGRRLPTHINMVRADLTPVFHPQPMELV